MVRTLTLLLLSCSCFWLSSMPLMAQPTAQQLDELLRPYEEPNGPGVAVTVTQNGRFVYENSVGIANMEYDIPITDSTVFYVASVSKQFTAFSILLLAQEGKLSLDDDIRKHLPELDIKERITIRQLANHTSGLRNSSELINMKGVAFESPVTHSEMVALLLRQKEVNFTPGEHFQYCNSGFVLMAEIVERVSGQSFATFTRERIFEPLEMNDTRFVDDPTAIVKNKAYSYKRSESGYQSIPFHNTVVGSTGLHTTTHDLSLWAMNFQRLMVGNEKLFETMKTKSTLNSGEQINYALGQEVKMYKGIEVIFHGGGDAGYRAYVLRIPDQNFSVVIAGNYEEFNPLELAYNIVDLYLSDVQTTVPEVIPDYSNEQLQTFAGTYQIFPGLYINIIAEADTLYFQGYGADDMLKLPVRGEQSFSFPYVQQSWFVFSEDQAHWHFSDFTYSGKRVILDPPNAAELNLAAFAGQYYSPEVETYYTLVIEDGQLIAQHNFNPDMAFKPIAKDAFITGSWFFSRLEFERDSKGTVTGCKVSGQNSKNVRFQKIP